jgi:hypothetical protein
MKSFKRVASTPLPKKVAASIWRTGGGALWADIHVITLLLPSLEKKWRKQPTSYLTPI